MPESSDVKSHYLGHQGGGSDEIPASSKSSQRSVNRRREIREKLCKGTKAVRSLFFKNLFSCIKGDRLNQTASFASPTTSRSELGWATVWWALQSAEVPTRFNEFQVRTCACAWVRGNQHECGSQRNGISGGGSQWCWASVPRLHGGKTYSSGHHSKAVFLSVPPILSGKVEVITRTPEFLWKLSAMTNAEGFLKCRFSRWAFLLHPNVKN